MSRLQLHFLTPVPRVSGDAGEIRITSKKGIALLVYLAMHRNEPVSRAVLANLLWSDRGDPQARQSLRQTLHTVRRELGDAHAGALTIDEASVTLNIATEDVDVLRFIALARSSDQAARLACLDVSWRPLLEHFSSGSEAFDDWVIAERHRLDLIATRMFSELAARLDAERDGERAIAALERLVQIDPTIEESHRKLLSLEARYRGTDAALSRARALAALLKRELDAEPEQATRDLIEAIRAQREGVAHRLPVASSESPTDQARVETPAGTLVRGGAGAGRFRVLAVAASVVVIAVGAVVYLLWPNRPAPPDAAAMRAEPAQMAEPSWQSPTAAPRPTAELSGKGLVAIAVRPFEHHASPGSETELVAAIISDDLTNVLSRLASFRVISQRTMDSYRGRQVDDAVVGAELGVRYLVEGSVAMRDGLLRMNVALTDTKTRLTVWSSRFERPIADRQATLDEIVAGLARELQIEVTRSESVAGQEHHDSHALIFRGWASMYDMDKDGKRALDQAEVFFSRALEIDADNPRALLGIAAVHTHLAVQLLTDDPVPHLAKAEKILRRVIERTPNSSEVHHVLGLMHIARGNPKAAKQAFEKTIEINPSHARGYAQLGRLMARLGQPEEGLEHIIYAKRLSPRDPSLAYWHAFSGAAKLELGRFDEAIADTRLALSMMPWQPRTVLLLVSALSMAGQEAEARKVLEQLQQAQPHLSNASLLQSYGNPKLQHLFLNQGMMRLLDGAKPAPN
jgi:DNA-binding SARP family transcriptional activator/TolB-like protein/Tfp pilus assembly protein PilF